MANTESKLSLVKRIFRISIIALVAYLVIVNLALQLPVTQTLVNAIRPGKFQVAWESAWSLVPFRVHATGISANGQSRSQQWQLHASSASGSINPLPLVFKRVWLSDVKAVNIQYRQRPRLKPDRDYSEILPFFPDIEGREITPAETSPRKKKRPWRIAVDGIEARGDHSFWVMQFRGSGSGTLSADFTFETRGGPFSLSNGFAELALNPLYINGESEVFNRGTVKGDVALAPFVPRESKGLIFLSYLTSDATVDFDVNSLAFISVLTRNFKQMTFDGTGRVAGRINIESGRLLTDTDFTVQASDLMVDVMEHRIAGRGDVVVGRASEIPDWLQLDVRFSEPSVTHIGDRDPLLVGATLLLSLTGSGELTGKADPTDNRRTMSFHINNLLAPNLSLFEHYLPEKWPLQLVGGQGRVDGVARVAPSAVDIDLSMKSEGADLGIQDYRFTSNLEAALKVSKPTAAGSNTTVGGSYIRLSGSRLTDRDTTNVRPWEASFEITEGKLGLAASDELGHDDNIRDLLQVLGKTDSKALLNSLTGFIDFESRVSSLGWVDVLLDGSHGTAVRGSGEVGGRLKLAEGMPAAGTDIEVLADRLSLDILDYTGTGSGRVSLAVREGDSDPDWIIGVDLVDAKMNRQGEEIAYIEITS